MRVLLTLRAERDLDHIAAYLYARSPRSARRVQSHLDAALRLIEGNPFVGRQGRQGTRRLSVVRYPYLVFYEVDEAAEEVRILTIRHAAHRPIA